MDAVARRKAPEPRLWHSGACTQRNEWKKRKMSTQQSANYMKRTTLNELAEAKTKNGGKDERGGLREDAGRASRAKSRDATV
jgi:hypothetical protein